MNVHFPLHVRPATTHDLSILIDIEDKAHHYPWPDATLHWALTHKNCRACILEQQQQILGFAIFACVLDEASLLNIAIDPEKQHQGLGRFLLSACLNTLDQTIHRVILEVRASNTNARQLYLNMGFTEIAIRRDYYPMFTGREDAHVMELLLPRLRNV